MRTSDDRTLPLPLILAAATLGIGVIVVAAERMIRGSSFILSCALLALGLLAVIDAGRRLIVAIDTSTTPTAMRGMRIYMVSGSAILAAVSLWVILNVYSTSNPPALSVLGLLSGVLALTCSFVLAVAWFIQVRRARNSRSDVTRG